MGILDVIEQERRIGEKAAVQRAARTGSPVSRPTPLSMSETTPSALRAVPVVGPAVGAVMEGMRQLDPTRVVSTGARKPAVSAAQATPSQKAETPADTPAKPEEKPTAVGGGGERIVYRDRPAPEWENLNSPADKFLAQYYELMGQEDGGVGAGLMAAGALNRYRALKPLDLQAQEARDLRTFREGQQGIETARESKTGAIDTARSRLLSAQAGVAESQMADEQRRQALLQKLGDAKYREADPTGYSNLERMYNVLYGSKGEKSSTASQIYKNLTDAGMEDAQARSIAGLPAAPQEEGFADGGQVPAYGGAPSKPPMLAQYGQYLHAAAAAGVPPVPFSKYINLLSATRSEMGASPVRYAEGGEVDVSGREILGPGTGTSDSIPAVIDGHRKAALSTGEFVIPAHVVRAKGTEFFDKLIAQYADKGQEDGE